MWGTLTEDVLLAMRDACLLQIEQLTGMLSIEQDQSQRLLLLSFKQARLIELGAIERHLDMPQTILPKHRRRPLRLC